MMGEKRRQVAALEFLHFRRPFWHLGRLKWLTLLVSRGQSPLSYWKAGFVVGVREADAMKVAQHFSAGKRIVCPEVRATDD